MKTLNDYILDIQRKEARFLTSNSLVSLHNQNQWKAYEVSRNAQVQAQSVLAPTLVYKTKDGREIPCHNKATYDYYRLMDSEGKL